MNSKAMNSRPTEFEWDYVPASTRRRVRRSLAAILLLAVAAVVVVGGGGSDEVRYFYEALAAEGNLGHVTRESLDPDTKDQAQVETAADIPPRQAALAPAIVPIPDPPAPPQLLDPTDMMSQVANATHTVRAERELPPAPPTPPPVPPPEPPPAPEEPSPAEADEPPETADKPKDERAAPEQLPPPAHGGLAETDGTPRTASVGSQEIVEGVTAPYYWLTSLDEYCRTAEECGGRFLAWNGQIAISIGRSLDPGAASLEVLDSSWHRRYATRMAPLPQNSPAVQAILQRVLAEYKHMGQRTQIMLSLPYAYDQEILRSQREWFESRGLPVDVQAVTEGRFAPAGRQGVPQFRIAQVFRDGKPVHGDPVPQQSLVLRPTDES